MARRNGASKTAPTAAFHMRTRRAAKAAEQTEPLQPTEAAEEPEVPVASQAVTSDVASAMATIAPATAPVIARKRKAQHDTALDIQGDTKKSKTAPAPEDKLPASQTIGTNEPPEPLPEAAVPLEPVCETRRVRFASPVAPQPQSTEGEDAEQRYPKRQRAVPAITELPASKKRRPNTPKRTVDKRELIEKHHDYLEETHWPEFDHNNPVYFAADGITQHTGSDREVSTPRAGNKSVRGGGAARGGRGGGNNNARGGQKGKGKQKGRGGRGDSPEPPRKKTMDEEEKSIVAAARARQNELKRFFGSVSVQQKVVNLQLADANLAKLVKSKNAHKRVPEFQLLVDNLHARRDEAQEHARQKMAFLVQQENERFVRETELIEQQFKVCHIIL